MRWLSSSFAWWAKDALTLCCSYRAGVSRQPFFFSHLSKSSFDHLLHYFQSLYCTSWRERWRDKYLILPDGMCHTVFCFVLFFRKLTKKYYNTVYENGRKERICGIRQRDKNRTRLMLSMQNINWKSFQGHKQFYILSKKQPTYYKHRKKNQKKWVFWQVSR